MFDTNLIKEKPDTMSFENYPSTEEFPQPVIQHPQNKWRNYLIAGLLIALLGTWAYIIWDKSNTREAIQQKDLVITNTSSQKDLLQNDLEEATRLYDQIKTNSANMVQSKDSTILRRDREIAEKRYKIQQLLSKVGATQEELTEAKNLIASLNGDITGYKTQIETLKGEKLDIVLSGSGDFDLAQIQYGDVKVGISGSGNVGVGGSTEKVELTLSGSGDLKAKDLKAQSVRCRISGSGNVACFATQELDALVSGSGDVRYSGSPASVKKRVSGSGRVEAR